MHHRFVKFLTDEKEMDIEYLEHLAKDIAKIAAKGYMTQYGYPGNIYQGGKALLNAYTRYVLPKLIGPN
jgi:ATP-dependent phosphoenolpyruvate carboxykinase